ncbi:BZIP domain-containing transcription [Stemphylium lycopersici]|uniref:BZIP domain-containing transcription n=1 Tax=Stemphylium lycopersici TaxID=183478 RepID=A0A364N9N5_STELY|nr:BZIP domain-containing transcription [Stemphylium lycopersici]RAR13721.1 BZIP domain-containing transcription [Stemphylium lycopersici]
MNTLAMPGGMGISSIMNTSAQMTRDYSQSGSSSSSHKDQSSSPPEQTCSSKLSSTKNSPAGSEPPSRIEKRKANTLAARRYRQKRVDQMSTLEAELKEVKAERDDLKVRNARLEGEVETLRALLRSQK